MANTVATSPGTCADDATVGIVAWTDPDNTKVSDDVRARANVADATSAHDTSIKIVKGGVISGDEKSPSNLLTNVDVYYSFGGSSDLWGLGWLYSDINANNFGVVYSAEGDATSQSHYLKATNFGFSIPTGATINGILAEIEVKYPDTGYNLGVDHIRITVYYTSKIGPFPTHFNI